MTAVDVSRRRRPAGLRKRLLPLLLYHAIFLVVGVVSAPLVLWRTLFDGKYRRALLPRTGRVPPTVGERPVVWVHGVSVGEVKGLARLAEAIERAHPEIEIVVSATTPTGFDLAQRLYAGRRVFHYPIDFGLFPGRALDRIRPGCVVLMELEVWPNFLQAASRRDIPVAVVNGRISEQSFRGYHMVRGVLPQFDWIDLFCVQDDVYRERLLALGVDGSRIAVTGNMKYDSVPLRGAPPDSARLRAWLAPDDRLVVVCGSTHGREEEWLARAVRRAGLELDVPVRVVLVPRHPERAPAVAEAVAADGTRVVRWSEVGGPGALAPLGGGDALLLDTIGQLEAFYGACDVAFVGGSLVPHGGQNMLEPAALGRAVLFGPHVANFRADVELLLQARAAIQVQGLDELDRALTELLRDRTLRAELGERAVALIRENQGATERTRRLIDPLLERAIARAGRAAGS